MGHLLYDIHISGLPRSSLFSILQRLHYVRYPYILIVIAVEVVAPVIAQAPNQWKEARAIPIPSSVAVINSNLCLISLTTSLSKTLESFVAEWIMKSIRSKLNSKQFGSLKGSSTVDTIIAMFHSWYADIEDNGETLRIFPLDFRKAFDRISHKVLATRMCQFGIDTFIVNWVIDFLTERRQRVRVKHLIG